MRTAAIQQRFAARIINVSLMTATSTWWSAARTVIVTRPSAVFHTIVYKRAIPAFPFTGSEMVRTRQSTNGSCLFLHILTCLLCADDLDLHVVTPGGAEVWYSNKIDYDSGGELDHDDIPLEDAFGNPIQNWVENVNFPTDGTSPQGTYTFFVVNYNQVQSADPWEVKSYLGDTVAGAYQGTLGHKGESAVYKVTL
jgi:hypothetical protein